TNFMSHAPCLLHKPPPRARGLQSDVGPRRQTAQNSFDSAKVVGKAQLPGRSLFPQYRQLGYSLVQINTSKVFHGWPPFVLWLRRISRRHDQGDHSVYGIIGTSIADISACATTFPSTVAVPCIFQKEP